MTEARNSDPKFWAVGDLERLTATTPDEAIEDYLDNIEPRDWPEAIEVRGFRPMVPSLPTFLAPLNEVLEALDEEYGDPEGDGHKPSEAMLEAQAQFLRTVCSEYVSWQCEEVERSTVDVSTWVLENRPDWLQSDRVDAEAAGAGA